MSDWDTAVGARIRTERERFGFSQRRLAELIGKDPSAVTRIEQGARSLTFEEAVDISRSLMIDLSELALHEAWETTRDEEVSHLRTRVADLERRLASIVTTATDGDRR